MKPFDIAPYALPNCPAGEFRFEEPRDIRQVVVQFKGKAPRRLRVWYLQDKWPRLRVEEGRDLEDPARFGWLAMDDWFNSAWRPAQVRRSEDGRTVRLKFKPLPAEGLPDTPAGYRVEFRRTLGLRLEVPDWGQVRQVAIHTCSPPARTRLRVELDAGRRTPGAGIELSGYNARLVSAKGLWGVREAGHALKLGKAKRRCFEVLAEHMVPAHRHCGDAGLLSFSLDRDRFTVSLAELDRRGPIWFQEAGIFIARADDATSFAEYRRRCAGSRTILQQVKEAPEHSYARARAGQPRPHPEAFSLGCKHSPQRFWLEANGDLLLHKTNLARLRCPGRAGSRFLARGNTRFFFGLETWAATSRCTDPGPAPIYNLHFRQGNLLLEQQIVCVPLLRSILGGELGYDEPMAALLRFCFANAGDQPLEARLSVHFSEDSRRARHAPYPVEGQDDRLVPLSPLTPLALGDGLLTSSHEGKEVVRAALATSMQAAASQEAMVLRQHLEPGQQCQALLKVPYLAPQTGEERAALAGLEFDRACGEADRFWRQECRRGAQLKTPLPQLDALHAAHLVHVECADFSMPDDPELINTSVGSSTYGNFSNESCMIVRELDERGLHQEARRRLDLWVKYQGTVAQPGNFSDCEGMYYGAGGFEQGHYNQHHGWVLWALAEHFLLSGDREWFGRVAGSVVAGADWIFRQRRLTLEELPHSRGWERGFLPAGSLEDVTEFYYWLSTNCLTWRGADSAARALEEYGHPEAGRVRGEAEAYRRALIGGLETARQHAPLVRLRDGRWVPQYPSRLYCRGRDLGWIRQVLEGAVYLLICGLYDADAKQAGWILDDYQDNLYLDPPWGYVLRDATRLFSARGGFSIQPALLAGLLPHLERDEPEVYLWMFFNALASVYREEIDGLIEHPMPELGFSNAVSFKTSDEANAVCWLRYMFVYWNRRLLHLGRALPRAWFGQEEEFGLSGVSTYFGAAGVRYQPLLGEGRLVARAEIEARRPAPRLLLRFRHPERVPLRAVRVNGEPWTAFDPAKGDVDLSGRSGSLQVEAQY